MAEYSGVISKMAFKKDRGLYGAGPDIAYPQTPGSTDMAAGHQLPFSSESLKNGLEKSDDDSLIGTGAYPTSDIVKHALGGGFSGKFRWRGLERLFLCGMGYENPNDSPTQLAVGAECHLFEIDHNLSDAAWSSDELDGYTPPSSNDRKVRRGQLGVYKGADDWVFYSSFVNAITISGTPADGVMAEFELVPYAMLRDDYNHDNWTLPTGVTTRILFDAVTVSLGTRAGGEGSLTDLRVNKFEIKIQNNLDSGDQTTESGKYIEQPLRSDLAKVMVTLELPRYNTGDDALLDQFDADTELALKIVCDGAQIGSTGYYRKWGFFMSSVRPAASMYDYPVDGPGAVRGKYELEAHQVTGTDIFAANHYNSITTVKDSALKIVTHNEDTTNYLLET
jgi:hypothetical protein